jgi:hypothetical protein
MNASCCYPENIIFVTVWRSEKTFPEIPPGLPFAKGGEVIYENSMNHWTFSPFEKGGLRGI